MIDRYAHNPDALHWRHLFDLRDVTFSAVNEWCDEALNGKYDCYHSRRCVYLDVHDDNDAVLVKLRFS